MSCFRLAGQRPTSHHLNVSIPIGSSLSIAAPSATSIGLQQRIIGLYSDAPGHGKTTAAQYLQYNHDFDRISFADPLRSAIYSILIDLGLDSGEAFSAMTRDKDALIPSVGVSARHMLRTLGTEWGRSCVHPEIWLKCWSNTVQRSHRVVTDDVRFPNEAELIRERGGVIWRIHRPGIDTDSSHASDGALQNWDGFAAVIVNNGTVSDLNEQLERAYQDYCGTLAEVA